MPRTRIVTFALARQRVIDRLAFASYEREALREELADLGQYGGADAFAFLMGRLVSEGTVVVQVRPPRPDAGGPATHVYTLADPE